MKICDPGSETLRLNTRVWSVASASAPSRAINGVTARRFGKALLHTISPGASGMFTLA